MEHQGQIEELVLPSIPEPGERIAKPRGTGHRLQQRNPEIEASIGLRLRFARLNAGLTLAELGARVDLSLQQLQKYEIGMDRVAASTLKRLSVILLVEPNWFLEGELTIGRKREPSGKIAFTLATAVSKITSPTVLETIRKIVEEAEREDASA